MSESSEQARPQPCAPFVIGTTEWPGIAKLAEECGELLQVIGKLIAFPDGVHPDGGPLLDIRLWDEMADVQAAIAFVVATNCHVRGGQDFERIDRKLDTFHGWHEQALAHWIGANDDQ